MPNVKVNGRGPKMEPTYVNALVPPYTILLNSHK